MNYIFPPKTHTLEKSSELFNFRLRELQVWYCKKFLIKIRNLMVYVLVSIILDPIFVSLNDEQVFFVQHGQIPEGLFLKLTWASSGMLVRCMYFFHFY